MGLYLQGQFVFEAVLEVDSGSFGTIVLSTMSTWERKNPKYVVFTTSPRRLTSRLTNLPIRILTLVLRRLMMVVLGQVKDPAIDAALMIVTTATTSRHPHRLATHNIQEIPLTLLLCINIGIITPTVMLTKCNRQ